MKLYPILLLSILSFKGHMTLAEEYNNIAVSGTIQNPGSKTIRVVLYNGVPGENNLYSVAELDPTDGFHFVSYIREPTFGQLFYDNQSIPLYLEPGYDLRLTFDTENMKESLQFSGVGDINNRFLVKRSWQYKIEEAALQDKIKRSGEAEFVEWAGARRQAQHELLKEEKATLSTDFVSLQEADIDYSWANTLFSYGRFIREFRPEENLTEDFYDFLDEVKLHNYEVILLQSYRDFLDFYLLHNFMFMKEDLSSEDSHFYSNMYKVARRSLRSLPMYHMQASYLVKALNYIGVDAVKDEYIEFANECPVQDYKNVLHRIVKEQTVTPKEPDVIFTDINGHSIPLKSLSGDIVLVRFTNYENDSARRSMGKQERDFKHTLLEYGDVKFLELPMEENKEAFRKMVYADATEYLKSIMNRPKPGQEKPKQHPYTYILLNRDGLVVSNSLDDPKNELALEKIDALLRQEKRSATIELN